MSDVAARVAAAMSRLSPAERRVAQVVVNDPEAVAFGTVARVAARAGSSGPTVVRMASRAGFRGFAGLQAAVQEEVASRLRPAAERIRQPGADDPLSAAANVESANVHDTLMAVSPEVFEAVIELLSDRTRQVGILPGDAARGVATVLADSLDMLREGVRLVTGSQVRVARDLAGFAPRDTLVAIDLRRYDRWLLETAAHARSRGVRLVAVTDSLLSPLAQDADDVFVVAAKGAGPFDSYVGTLALANALVTGVAGRLRSTATGRLDRLEEAWRRSATLVEP